MLQLSFPFINKSHETSNISMYLQRDRCSVAYQVKTARLLGLSPEDPSQINSDAIISSLIKIPLEKEDKPLMYCTMLEQYPKNIDDLDDSAFEVVPYISTFPNEELEDFVATLGNWKSANFVNYATGMLYETGRHYKRDLAKAMKYYEQGAENKELGCLLRLARIYMEKPKANAFKVERSPVEALHYLLLIFRFHGLFDRYQLKTSTLKPVAIFNVYMDCYPEFSEIVHRIARMPFNYFTLDPREEESDEESRSQGMHISEIWDQLLKNEKFSSSNDRLGVILYYHQLLALLAEPELFSDRSIKQLEQLERSTKSKDNPMTYLLKFLVAELYDISFFGVTLASEFDKRLALYSAAEEKGHITACSRLAVMQENLEKFNQQKGIQTDNKSQTSTHYVEKLSAQPTEDYFLLKASSSSINLSDPAEVDALISLQQLVYYLPDTRSLLNYFRLMKMKKDPKIFQVAKRMQRENLPFYQIPLAYCYEKGKGTQPNRAQALELYRDLFEKQMTTRPNDPKHFIFYRLGCLFNKEDGAQEAATIYFRLSIAEISALLKKKPLEVGFLYDMARLVEKGRGVPENSLMAGSLYRWIINLPHKTLSERFMRKYAEKRLSLLTERKKLSLDELNLMILTEGSEKENTNIIQNWLKQIDAQIGHTSIDYAKLVEARSFQTLFDHYVPQTEVKEKQTIEQPVKTYENENMKKSWAKIDLQGIASAIQTRKATNYQKLTEIFAISDQVVKWTRCLKELAKHSSVELVLSYVQDLMKAALADFNIMCFTDDRFEHEEKNAYDQGSVPKTVLRENGQTFGANSIKLPLKMLVKVLVEQPLAFHMSASFLNPYVLPTYGINFNLLGSEPKITLYQEEFLYTLEEYCSAKPALTSIDRTLMVLRIARAIESLAILRLGHYSLNGASFVITKKEGLVKLANPLYLLIENPQNLVIGQNVEEVAYKGDYTYFSPEHISGEEPITTYSDSYAFGLLVYLVFTQERLFTTDDLSNKVEFLHKLKEGSFNDRVLLKHSFPKKVTNLIVSCLNYHPKKRPTISHMITELQAVLAELYEGHANKNIPVVSVETAIVAQYSCAQFVPHVSEKKRKIILPANIYYEGELKNGLPHGDGTLMLASELEYSGSFTEGLFDGEATLTLLKRDEHFKGMFSHGYPTKGIYQSESSEALEIEYEPKSWIPKQKFRAMMTLGGFVKFKKGPKEKAINYAYEEDERNDQVISKFVEVVTNPKPGKKINAYDIMGNHYYCSLDAENVPTASDEIIVRDLTFFNRNVRVFSPSINVLGIANISIPFMELASIGKEHDRLGVVNVFEEAVRYYHFGFKFFGRMSKNKPNQGVFFIKSVNYFSFNSSSKVYKGKSYMRDTDCFYEGEFYQSRAHGNGSEFKGNYKKYEGEYLNGQPHGKGITYDDAGKAEFKGIVKQGKPVYGCLYNENKIYEGLFERRAVNDDEGASESNAAMHTYFRGTVYNFSSTIRELEGGFILEEKKFNGYFKILYTDGSYYEGQMRDGVREGQGSYKMSNGNIFEGLWHDQKLKGRIIWGAPNTAIQISEGEFIREKNGPIVIVKIGRLKFRNGDIFEGEIKEGKLEGFGVYYSKKGGLFEGYFSNNQRSGIGKFTYKKDGVSWTYIGEYAGGRKDGIGKLYKEGQVVFEGEWRKDHAHFGKLYFDGEGSEKIAFYLGEVDGDGEKRYVVPDGVGKIQFKDSIVFEGEFKDGKVVAGTGGTLIREEIMEYRGQVNEDFIPHGLGIATYKKAWTMYQYKGEFYKGVKNGIGSFLYRDDSTFEGEVKDDLRNGVGKLVKGKTVFKGEFKANERSGMGFCVEKRGKEDVIVVRGLYTSGKISKAFL